MLAGMTIRPRATSERTSSGSRSSRRATNSISGVIDALAGGFELRHDRTRFPTPVRTGSGSRGVISAAPDGAGTPSDATLIVDGWTGRSKFPGGGQEPSDGKVTGRGANLTFKKDLQATYNDRAGVAGAAAPATPDCVNQSSGLEARHFARPTNAIHRERACCR